MSDVETSVDDTVVQDEVVEETYSPFTWIAVYDEDDFLSEVSDSGEKARYADIDRERLKEFHVVNKETGATVFAMSLDPGQRLIFRRRVSMNGMSGEREWEIIMAGWQQTVNGANVQSISWVFPNGSIIQTGRFRDDHRLFYGVDLLDFEHIEVGEDA